MGNSFAKVAPDSSGDILFLHSGEPSDVMAERILYEGSRSIYRKTSNFPLKTVIVGEGNASKKKACSMKMLSLYKEGGFLEGDLSGQTTIYQGVSDEKVFKSDGLHLFEDELAIHNYLTDSYINNISDLHNTTETVSPILEETSKQVRTPVKSAVLLDTEWKDAIREYVNGGGENILCTKTLTELVCFWKINSLFFSQVNLWLSSGMNIVGTVKSGVITEKELEQFLNTGFKTVHIYSRYYATSQLGRVFLPSTYTLTRAALDTAMCRDTLVKQIDMWNDDIYQESLGVVKTVMGREYATDEKLDSERLKSLCTDYRDAAVYNFNVMKSIANNRGSYQMVSGSQVLALNYLRPDKFVDYKKPVDIVIKDGELTFEFVKDSNEHYVFTYIDIPPEHIDLTMSRFIR
jgi:hypothetical protein